MEFVTTPRTQIYDCNRSVDFVHILFVYSRSNELSRSGQVVNASKSSCNSLSSALNSLDLDLLMSCLLLGNHIGRDAVGCSVYEHVHG